MSFGITGKLKTLLERWTQTKADYLDAPISGIASGVRMTTSGYATGYLAQSYIDVPITEVLDINKCVVSINGYKEVAGTYKAPLRGVFHTTSVIRVHFATASQFTMHAGVQVTEFN